MIGEYFTITIIHITVSIPTLIFLFILIFLANSQACVPLFESRGGGSAVFVSSIGGFQVPAATNVTINNMFNNISINSFILANLNVGTLSVATPAF